jgi:hypothetical protein
VIALQCNYAEEKGLSKMEQKKDDTLSNVFLTLAAAAFFLTLITVGSSDAADPTAQTTGHILARLTTYIISFNIITLALISDPKAGPVTRFFTRILRLLAIFLAVSIASFNDPSRTTTNTTGRLLLILILVIAIVPTNIPIASLSVFTLACVLAINVAGQPADTTARIGGPVAVILAIISMNRNRVEKYRNSIHH